MEVVKPPDAVTDAWPRPWVFLAGSIEMGVAEDWQAVLQESLQDVPGTILNPRREAWDASWTQAADAQPFRGQVEWELDGLAAADVVAFYFAPGTKSPITLLELGLTAGPSRVVVCCPDGFWRKGNVDIVGERAGVEQVPSLVALTASLRARLSAAAAPSSPDPSIRIAPAEVEDAAALVAYAKAVSGETDFLGFGEGEFDLTVEAEAALIAGAASRGDLLLVARDGDEVVGFLSTKRPQRPRTRHGVVFGISVRRSHWGRGVGRRFMEALCAWADAGDVRRIELRVRADNARAIRLYRAFGFVDEGHHRASLRIGGRWHDERTMARVRALT